MRLHRRQPTRPRRPWDSPGKNTGVGCHFLLQCMKVKSESEVAQSCPTLRDPMDCSPLSSSVHRIFQVRVLEWGAIAFSNLIKLFMPKTSFISVKTIKVDYISHTIYKNLKPQNPYKKTQAVYFLSLVLAMILLDITWKTEETKIENKQAILSQSESLLHSI